jgi:hypothetical protein
MNISDEGGGEEDKATYDLNVLRTASNGAFMPGDKIPMEDLRQRRGSSNYCKSRHILILCI